jgi:hypothetical protein
VTYAEALKLIRAAEAAPDLTGDGRIYFCCECRPAWYGSLTNLPWHQMSVHGTSEDWITETVELDGGGILITKPPNPQMKQE